MLLLMHQLPQMRLRHAQLQKLKLLVSLRKHSPHNKPLRRKLLLIFKLRR